jgi:hypothetical protein
MTTTFKTVAVLTLLGAVALGAAGFAVRADADAPPPTAAARAEPLTHEPPKVPDAPPGEPDDPEMPASNRTDGMSGFVHSVELGTNALFVKYDDSGIQKVGIWENTKIFFAGKPAQLADLAPGMRVHLRFGWGTALPVASEVRAHWRPLLPDVKRVNVERREITFETPAEHGTPLEVTLRVAPDVRLTADGARGLLTAVPHGKATWVSLSSDRKSVIGLRVFTKAYDVAGTVIRTDLEKRTVTIELEPDAELMLPVAADVQVVVDGERATLKEVQGYMRVLLRRSANGTSITGIVAVHPRRLVALPEPKQK